jgi:NAD(P)H-hydrate epimerase
MPSPTLRPLSREEVRSIDARAVAECGVPTLILMENAGRGAADVFRARFAASRVLILCGPGNNGGDGAVVARHLDLSGYTVRVVWCAEVERLSGDALTQWTILSRSGFDQSGWLGPPFDPPLDAALAWPDVIVDALLGTGLTRPVEGRLRAAIEAVSASGKPVFSLDLPSGLDCDSGHPLGASIRAAATATFVAPKLGFLSPAASAFTGDVSVVDIGAPRRLLEPFSQP